MASRLNPYISFEHDARQAMEFYKEVFGGTLALSTFGEFGQADSPIADKIMHGMLETDNGFTIMGADTAARHGPQPRRQHHGQPERRRRRRAVAATGTSSPAAGKVDHARSEKQMWGDEFGQCVDQFGIPWMVNITAKLERLIGGSGRTPGRGSRRTRRARSSGTGRRRAGRPARSRARGTHFRSRASAAGSHAT